jgi:hypothetical protein
MTTPTPEDVDLITQTSQDYIEGWFTANAERMRSCLHPDLIKRTLIHDPAKETWLLYRPSNAHMMVEFTRKGGGSDLPDSERTYEIIIQDVFRHIACVKVISRFMMDYLHLVKLNERWFILNVLWELREGEIGPD